jgi:hypothetical protein
MRITMLQKISLLILAATSAGFVFLPPPISQVQEPLRPERRWEVQWARAVPVSGMAVPGVMIGPQTAPARAESITLRIPRRHTSTLCVTITSQDGRYYAQAPFHVPTTTSGVITLEGPSQHRRRVRQYPAGELAIIAEFTDRCGSPGRTQMMIPASWGGETGSSDVFVYVNSRYHTEALWRDAAGRSVLVPCPEIGNDRYVAYNRVCRITRTQLPDSVSVLVRSRVSPTSYSNTSLLLRHSR